MGSALAAAGSETGDPSGLVDLRFFNGDDLHFQTHPNLIYNHIYICICVYVYMYMYICMYIYILIYVLWYFLIVSEICDRKFYHALAWFPLYPWEFHDSRSYVRALLYHIKPYFAGKSSSGWWFGPFFIFPYIGNFIIPIDELLFFRGVLPNHQPAKVDVGPPLPPLMPPTMTIHDWGWVLPGFYPPK